MRKLKKNNHLNKINYRKNANTNYTLLLNYTNNKVI